MSVGEEPEFRFSGPAAVRNYQPIQLIFLNLPAEDAGVVGAGGWRIDVETVESNEIATSVGKTDAVLKFETNRTVFGLRYGIAEDVEIGVHLPFVTRYGGFLDGFIDGVESIVDLRNCRAVALFRQFLRRLLCQARGCHVVRCGAHRFRTRRRVAVG